MEILELSDLIFHLRVVRLRLRPNVKSQKASFWILKLSASCLDDLVIQFIWLYKCFPPVDLLASLQLICWLRVVVLEKVHVGLLRDASNLDASLLGEQTSGLLFQSPGITIPMNHGSHRHGHFKITCSVQQDRHFEQIGLEHELLQSDAAI